MGVIDREFLSQVIIVLTICIGGWVMFVKPRADELRTLEQQIGENRLKATTLDHETVSRVAAHAPGIRLRCRKIQERGALATNSSALYGQIKSLAQAFDIDVKSLRPGVENDNENDLGVSVTRVDMTAEGEFEKIADFLGALDDLAAYLRPISVQFAPTKRAGGSYTVIQLGLEAVRFTLPAALKELGGTS
jgi:hypothetical protein